MTDDTDLRIAIYAMVTIAYTSGICPFCKAKIGERKVKLSDVQEHIKGEYSLWAESYKKVMGME